MTRKASLNSVIAYIHKEHAKLHSSDAGDSVEELGAFGSDIGDRAAQGVASEESISRQESRGEHAAKVADALRRVQSGTFGLCEECLAEGKSRVKAEIAIARLKALPFALLCAGHQKKFEEVGVWTDDAESGSDHHGEWEDDDDEQASDSMTMEDLEREMFE